MTPNKRKKYDWSSLCRRPSAVTRVYTEHDINILPEQQKKAQTSLLRMAAKRDSIEMLARRGKCC